MNKLFIRNVSLGILIAGSAGGMMNSTPQGINDNNSGNNVSSYAVSEGISNHSVNSVNSSGSYVNNVWSPGNVGNVVNRNVEGNQVFLPVMNRRFSDGMINLSGWSESKKQNQMIPSQAIIKEGSVVLGQQQNGREFPVQGSRNGTYINQGYYNQTLLVQNVPNSSTSFIPQEINGNTNENTIFLPVLRSQNAGNQVNNTEKFSYSRIRRNSIVNVPPQQQYSNQGYFPQSGINKDTMNPSFTLTDILQITDQQIRINGEMRRKLSELKQQNELLKNREMYFFPDKIAQQQRQIMKLEEFIIDQNKKHQEELDELRNQQIKDAKLDRMVILEQKNAELIKKIQRYKNGNGEKKISELKDQVKKLKDQIKEKDAIHEAEIKDLKDQLQKEKQLNAALNLSSGSILENDN